MTKPTGSHLNRGGVPDSRERTYCRLSGVSVGILPHGAYGEHSFRAYRNPIPDRILPQVVRAILEYFARGRQNGKTYSETFPTISKLADRRADEDRRTLRLECRLSRAGVAPGLTRNEDIFLATGAAEVEVRRIF